MLGLKEMISASSGFNPFRQRLYYNQKELMNCVELFRYQIKNEAIIKL